MDYIDERYFKAINKFEENGFEVTQGSNSNTEYGHSRYFYVNKNNESQDNSGLGFQVRVSDHSVLSNRRLSETQILNDGDVDGAFHKINYWFNPKEYVNKNVVVKKQSKIEVPEDKLMDTDVILSERLAKTGRKIYNVERTYEFDAFIPTHIESGFALPLKMKNPDIRFEDGGLIAPNGKKSNLTAEQYKLVRTKAFKDWFGDWENDPENASKVVDENGEPLVVYHGTNNQFTKFKLNPRVDSIKNNLYQTGLWFFAPSFDKSMNENERAYFYKKGNAEFMAETWMANKDEKGNLIENRVIKAFLNVRKPKIVNGLTDSQAEELVYYSEKMRQLKKNDAVIMHGCVTDGNVFRDDINVLEPTQIKLADGSNTTFDGSNPDIRYDDGGEVKSNSFMKWYIDWYKGISDKMFIAISLPTIVTPFKEKNVVILDVFEKKDQSIDAKPYLKKIVEKADEYGVVIYLEPNPRHKYFQDNTEKKNKITKEYLVDYYQRFGFELTPNKQFMKRVPHFAEGGSLPNLLHIVIENVNPEKKYFGHYKKIFDIIDEDVALYNPYGTEDEKMIGNDFHIWISPIPDNDKIEKIKKLKGVKVLSNYYAEGGSVKRHNKEIMKKIKRGGITYGASHDNGGIPVKNASTGDMLEVEGGEGIVNKRSMASGKKVKLNGQEMTICEAVSQLNQMEGGVSFSCDDVEDMQFIEEMALGGELERGVRTEKEHIQVLKDLYSKRITPNEATRKIAEDHLKEDERYYSKLAKMEGKMAKGGEIYDDEGNVIYLKVGDRVIEFRQKTPNNPKSQIGGEGKIIQIVGVMAKVVFEPNDYEQWVALKDLKKIDDGKMAKGGKVGESYNVPSSEDLVEMVMKAKDKAIRKNRELGIPVVIGRYDGYGAILSKGKDFETILSTRPSRRKVIEIIENNPDIIEVFFLGTIKGADRVGEEMEYLDDFVVTLWKKPIDVNNAIGTTFQWTDTIQDPKNPNKEIRADQSVWMIVKQEDAHVYKDRPTDDNYFYVNTFNEKNGEQSSRRMPKSDFKEFIDEGFIEIVEVSQALKEQLLKPMPNYKNKMAGGGSVSTLLAPNGKPSNLNAEQYHLVRTPEFKAWFGDWEKLAMAKVKDPAMDEVTLANLSKDVSKVVDENGQPLVVYHGTPYEFTIFKKDKPTIGAYGQGFYFTNDKGFASNYAKIEGSKILTCFLNVKKIFEIDNDELPIGYEKYSDMADNKGKSRDFTIKLKSLLYDGVFAKNTYNENEFVVFEPNQVKLADGTNTTFDGSNPDIRFEDGGETDEDNLSYAEAQERWNKKAGIPSQKEALAFVKENPEILAMLKNGGEIMDCGCGSYGNGGYVDTFVDERIVSKVEDKDNPFAKFGLKKNFRGDTFVRLDAIEEKSINFCDSFPQVCGKNMGILREDMPQIYEEYIPEYLDFLKDMGVDAKLEYDIPVKELTATQEDISVPRMSRMLKRLLNGYYIDSDGNRINPLKRKLIITKDNYVLDGHHRWATMYFLSPNNTIDALRVNADIKDIVPISKNFGMVQFQKFMYGGKVGVIGFTNSDGLGVEVNASSLKYLKITRNIFPKAGLKISPLITYNNDTLPTMVFSDNGFQIDDVGKRNLKFNTLRDIKSSLSGNLNDAIADYNLSIPDKDKQIFLEDVGYATSLESGLLNVRAILKRVNQIDTPAISIYFYQYKSASITFSFIFNDKFIELYGDDLDVLEAILNGFSQTFKDSDNMDALVIDGNSKRSRKPRTAKSQPQQPTQQPTQQGGYWRFKTEQELENELGVGWKSEIESGFVDKMNYLLGQKIDNDKLENGKPKLDKTINTKGAYGITSGKDDFWAIIDERLFKYVPETTQQAPTQQGGYWRFKTLQELEGELGQFWSDVINGTFIRSTMSYLLGQNIDNDKLVDGKPQLGRVNTKDAYGITSGIDGDYWLIKDERLFKFIPETTQQAPTQQGGYWRFKTEQELEDELGSSWRNKLIDATFPSSMDYLLGQKIDNDKLENAKPKLGRFLNTKDAYGITSGIDGDIWSIKDERLFKFIPETTQQAPTQQGGYWRFKTEQELEDEYGTSWRDKIFWGITNKKDYLFGQKIDNNKLVDGKPKLGTVNTEYAYGITSGVDDLWDIEDERVFKYVRVFQFSTETTAQPSNSQLVPTKELDKKIQEVQDLMNSELFSPDEVVVQQVLIDELKKLNDQKQKSILSNYYSNDLNDLLQLYAQNISKGQRLTMDVACGKETPSGVPSELDETQYTLVRTPQFKAWFGDWEEAYKTKNYSGVSKAINEKTGEPLVVYHGKGNMKVEATYFKLTGFPIKYFAENKSYSEWFKNNYNAVNILYEFFINVSNPIDLSMVALDEITPQTFVDLIEALYDYKIQTPLMMPDRAVKVWQILRGNPKMLTEIKEKTNYDGFIIFENNPQDIVNGKENITKDFIAYENNQYKSADGRNTTFFMDVEDFRFEKGGVTQHTL